MNISLTVMEMVGMGLREVWKCPASDWYPGLKGAYSAMPGWESGSYVSRGWWVGGVTSGCWFSADGTRLTPAPPQHTSKEGQNGDIPMFRGSMGFWGLQCLPTSIPKAYYLLSRLCGKHQNRVCGVFLWLCCILLTHLGVCGVWKTLVRIFGVYLL